MDTNLLPLNNSLEYIIISSPAERLKLASLSFDLMIEESSKDIIFLLFFLSQSELNQLYLKISVIKILDHQIHQQ